MTDWVELKRLAEAALRNWPDSKLFDRPECDRFIDAARPDVVLTLIAEVEQLRAVAASIYRAGWDESGEGWNAEYPGDVHCKPEWNERMELAIDAAMSKGKADGWRAHSANYAKGEKCPATIETLQAAWDRDQELLLEQKAEISKLKEKLNQTRQKLGKSGG